MPPLVPSVPGDVRLCDESACSPTLSNGRVEIFHDGVWGTVCDDGWGQDEARAVCRQLGFRDAQYHWSNAMFGSGTGPIWMDDTVCQRQSTRLDSCSLSQGWGAHNCGHTEDAGVSCDPLHDPPTPPNPPPAPPSVPLFDGDLRLVNGANAMEGRLEIYHCSHGTCSWGTVCDDEFGEEEATVACRQMGLGMGSRWQGSARYERGSGVIWLDDLACTGSEARLGDCPFRRNTWGSNDCSHSEDAGLVCVPPSPPTPGAPPEPPGSPPLPPQHPWQPGDVRLVDGPTPHAGRVEILHDGIWGTVCDDGWGQTEARAVCHQLGYQDAAPYQTSIVDPGWGIDYSYSYASSYSYGGSSYGDSDDPWYGDSDSPDPGIIIDPLPPQPVRPGDETGDTSELYSMMHYGRGTGPIWLDDVACREGAFRLDTCDHRLWGSSDCQHSEDVGVRCVGERSPTPPSPPPLPPLTPSYEGMVRLVDGSADWEGRVEVFHGGLWGTVCDDYWGQEEAETADQ